MDWLQSLFFSTDSVAHIILLYALVISVGIGLGRIKVGGISLGVTFVLFAGIVAGHFGFTGTYNVLSFIQDFGLILFVYCIGLQVGPGFFESFKKGGVQLNLMAMSIILLNVLCCIEPSRTPQALVLLPKPAIRSSELMLLPSPMAMPAPIPLAFWAL